MLPACYLSGSRLSYRIGYQCDHIHMTFTRVYHYNYSILLMIIVANILLCLIYTLYHRNVRRGAKIESAGLCTIHSFDICSVTWNVSLQIRGDHCTYLIETLLSGTLLGNTTF